MANKTLAEVYRNGLGLLVIPEKDLSELMSEPTANNSSDADAEFLKQWESCTLPFEQWTHRAHVKVAYLCLLQHPVDEALTHMRAGIQRYNAANKVVESATSGYNETTTRAFLHLVAAVLQAYGETFPVKSADEFCDAQPQLMTRHALRFFYSPARRMHPLAKTRFVEPDLAPLPKLGDRENTGR